MRLLQRFQAAGSDLVGQQLRDLQGRLREPSTVRTGALGVLEQPGETLLQGVQGK